MSSEVRKSPSPDPFSAALKLGFILLLIVTAVTAPWAAAQTCTGIPDEECQALYALYNSTGGPQWKDSTNWLTSEPVNDWEGITVEGGHITKIILGLNGLTGPIPPELGNLSQLKFLSICSNKLTGPIPPELGNLTQLTGLYFDTNNLAGSIPPELGNLSNLRGLNLIRNDLTGSIPPELGNLASLEHLQLYENDLTGPIPPELGNLTNLDSLMLHNNQLDGPIPPELGNLARLEWLELEYNDLSGEIPPELATLSNLTMLSAFANKLSGGIPPELGSLACLQYLNFAGNNLTGPVPPELGFLSNLIQLSFRNNKLSGSIPPELGGLASLEVLFLQNNCLTGPVPGELGDLERLKELYLDSNNLSGDLPDFLTDPPFHTNLKFNRLYALNPDVLDAMEDRHDGKFISTQTLPPENIRATAVSDSGNLENRIEVSWDPISYTDDPGGYQVFYQREGDTEFHYGGMTHNKAAGSFRVSSLEPGVEYTFKVNTVTWQHRYNQSELYSTYSDTAAAVSGILSRAIIPAWKQAPGCFTGVVVSNFGETDFNLSMTAYDQDGSLEVLGRNPATSSIGAGRQESRLGVEFFSGDPYHEDFSWIELKAENSNQMGSIFLFGASDTKMLDGAGAQSAYARKLYFTRPLEHGLFPGWVPDIQMCIVNPTDEEVSVTCRLKSSYYDDAEKSHVIPARGFIQGSAEELVTPDHGFLDAYLEVEVTNGPGVVGFSRIEFPGVRTALGMNAVGLSSAKKMYSAQLAHGLNIVTSLRLINPVGLTRNVTLTAIGDDGQPLADPVVVEMPGILYTADLGRLFGLEDEGITTGSLVVESDGCGVFGDIIFADGNTMEYAMSLPLQDELFQEAVFNHISNLPTVFTGFAFFKPGNENAELQIEAFGTDGDKVAEKTLIIGPGERIARILNDPDIWPEFIEMSGGYIKIRSTRPIAGQQLFGNRSLHYMAAVPPTTRMEPMFD